MTNRLSVSGGRRVLVVEDEAIIGLALCELVEDEGCAVCGPFTRSDHAIAWLEGGETADVAIVDHILRDGPCTDLVRVLKARGIPFVIYSGDVRHPGMPVELQQATWLEKPGHYAELCDTLAGVGASAPA
jgi:DNA-binding NtrC family response regulator